MRVALVCPYDWAKPGGVRAHVFNLAGYLAESHAFSPVFAADRAAGAV